MSFITLFQDNAALFSGVVFFISLLIGSFLNVVIYRLPVMMEMGWRHQCQMMDAEDPESIPEPDKFNLATPRSRCPACNASIHWWQNIPVLSWLMLRGKCAECGARISLRYPVIELTTALFSAWVAWQFGFSWQGFAGIAITWALVCLTMIDFDHQLLPDSLTLPLLWLALLGSLVPVFVEPADAIIGGAAGYLALWSVYWLFKLVTGKEGMGYGDFKLLAALGAWFGWQSLPMIILLSSVVGAAVGITLIVAAGRDRQIPIPFGPYLAAAGWLYMMFGETLGSFFPASF